jgi:ribonuclease D
VSEEVEVRPPVRDVPITPVLPIVSDAAELNHAIEQLMLGTGSIAIDAERASGYKYFQRAYLIQLYRVGAPIVLIDPIDLDLTVVQNLLNQTPWILHAATQDLPCLNELGLYPPELFDTELAAKLAGLPRVGLATLTETLLEVSLAKEHSAVNWSIRPLQQDWLNYAALDVELLPALKSKLEELLKEQDRLSWANQEFELLKNFKPNAIRSDQWRRTSGMHELPNKRQKAVVRELWLKRDELAQQLDISPGRLINDRVLVALAKAAVKPVTTEQIRKSIRGIALDYLDIWLNAILMAQQLSEAELPKAARRDEAIPNPKSWEEINPAAFSRWSKYRPAATELASELGIAPEVLVSPDSLRRYCWDENEPKTESEIEQRLFDLGVRGWAAQLLALKFVSTNL